MGPDHDWARIFNRLWELIDAAGTPSYFSGSRFINVVRQIDPYHPDYNQYLEQRKATRKSTSRRVFFYDLLKDFEPEQRVSLLHRIMDEIEQHHPEKVQELRALLGGQLAPPIAHVDPDAWNAERLKRDLDEIDACIASNEFKRAITLAYSCLEGFYKAFVRKRVPAAVNEKEIVALSREIRAYIERHYANCPPEVLKLLTHITHAIDRARNQFSESHFQDEATRWMAVYMRDLLNTQIRLLSHFLNE